MGKRRQEDESDFPMARKNFDQDEKTGPSGPDLLLSKMVVTQKNPFSGRFFQVKANLPADGVFLSRAVSGFSPLPATGCGRWLLRG
jgi:hypothetical protein